MLSSWSLHFGCMTLGTNTKPSQYQGIGWLLCLRWRWTSLRPVMMEKEPWSLNWADARTFMGVSAATTWHWVCRVRLWHSHEENIAFSQHPASYMQPKVWAIQRGMAFNTFLIQPLRNVAQAVIGYLIKLEHLARQYENYKSAIAG